MIMTKVTVNCKNDIDDNNNHKNKIHKEQSLIMRLMNTSTSIKKTKRHSIHMMLVFKKFTPPVCQSTLKEVRKWIKCPLQRLGHFSTALLELSSI